MTILSVNKTRELMGALRLFFMGWARLRPFFALRKDFMEKKTKSIVHGAMIGAIYVVLTHLQNLLFPGSASMAIQFRLSEALCVLAFFTPAAIPGLTVGCVIFNLTFAGSLPLDPVVGGLATLVAAWVMWRTRDLRVRGCPLLGLLMPALTNAILVGWELELYIGGGFWFNAVCVAIGEAGVLLTLGWALYRVLGKRKLYSALFG